MNNPKKLALSLLLVLMMLAPACTFISPPTPTPTSTPTATATSEPTSTFTPTPTFTPTSTPTPTPTSTPTSTSTPTPTPAATSTPLPTSDPLPDRQTYSSAALRFSVAYPGTWQAAEGDGSFTLKDKDLIESDRAKGAELIVVAVPVKDPSVSLQAQWVGIPAAFPDVSFGDPVAITIGGEEGVRAIFSDPRDNSYGWFIITRHDGIAYIIIAQAFPGSEAWARYESTFRAILGTFWFL